MTAIAPKPQQSPVVSVVMPAYNAGNFIGEVIATVIEQTFTDFEFIIIDDGSTDNTAEVIKKYASIDPRIRYYHQENQGSKRLGETLNKGISYAKGTWIARADADDPWYLDKLEKQMDFVAKHPDYILIGGAADVINQRGVFLYTLLGPLDDIENRRSLTLYTTLAHGSVLFKKSVFEKVGGYRNIHAVEDLDLWQRMSKHGKIHNIPEPLFKYRKNTLGISMQNQDLQTREVEKLGLEYFLDNPPEVLSQQAIKKQLDATHGLKGNPSAHDYYADELYGRIIADNIRIAKLHIKHLDKRSGYRQLYNIAMSSKYGLKQVVKLLAHNVKFRIFRV